MPESVFTPWANFYVIIGSSAAALTGLMFVVVTLVTETRARRTDMGIAAFSTPTVVHYCVALAVAAILSAPWHTLWHAGLLLGLCGFGGLGYSMVVVRRMRSQTVYRPVLEDWSWHVLFPIVSYIALVIAALRLAGDPASTLFMVGAATVLLLFIGIHNAWDNVTYLIVNQLPPPNEDPEEGHSGDVLGEGQAHTHPLVNAEESTPGPKIV
jgi:hypothetical protein